MASKMVSALALIGLGSWAALGCGEAAQEGSDQETVGASEAADIIAGDCVIKDTVKNDDGYLVRYYELPAVCNAPAASGMCTFSCTDSGFSNNFQVDPWITGWTQARPSARPYYSLGLGVTASIVGANIVYTIRAGSRSALGAPDLWNGRIGFAAFVHYPAVTVSSPTFNCNGTGSCTAVPVAVLGGLTAMMSEFSLGLADANPAGTNVERIGVYGNFAPGATVGADCWLRGSTPRAMRCAGTLKVPRTAPGVLVAAPTPWVTPGPGGGVPSPWSVPWNLVMGAGLAGGVFGSLGFREALSPTGNVGDFGYGFFGINAAAPVLSARALLDLKPGARIQGNVGGGIVHLLP